MHGEGYSISDDEIRRMIESPKYVKEKINLDKLCTQLRLSEDGRQYEKTVELECDEYDCQMRIRQSVDRPTNFSVILVCKDSNKNDQVVLRLNGNHGRHKNRIEKNVVEGPHIHIMTERYQLRTTHPDGYAEATDEYVDLEGAVQAFIDMANIGYAGTRSIRKLEEYDERDAGCHQKVGLFKLFIREHRDRRVPGPHRYVL